MESKSDLQKEKLVNDERVAIAKKLLLDALREHSAPLKTIQPPKAGLKESYRQALHALTSFRGSDLFYPYLGSGIGNGVFVELLDGSVKMDFISGIGVHHWGHSHPEILSACIDAALSDIVIQGNLQQNHEAVEISELLIKNSGLDHCFLSSSGAIANENALKVALQKNYPAYRILAFERCFMGRTLATSQISDKPRFRDQLPPNCYVDYVPFFDSKQPHESTEKAVSELSKLLHRYPGQIAVMVVELIQGEAGAYPGSREFFLRLFSLLREHKVAIFIDEIQTFGRTPALFATQFYQLTEFADIITIGKLSQVCATLFTKEYAPKKGLLSQTFTANTASLIVGKLIITKLLEEGYFGKNGKIKEIEKTFHQKLQNLCQKYPDLIEGPFGIGALVAFTPFKGDEKKVLKFVHKLFDAGLICFIAGLEPSRVRFLVPVGAITLSEIDLAMEIVEKTLLEGV